MKQCYKYDQDGYYLEPIILLEGEEVPDNTTEIMPPQPMWQARFNGTEWIEESPKPNVEDNQYADWDSEAKVWNIIEINPQ